MDATENSQYLDAVGTANWTYSFDSTTVADGSLIIKALATASNSNSSIVSSGVTVDNTEPSGAISSPADASAVAGTVLITGTAADNLALAETVDSVNTGIDASSYPHIGYVDGTGSAQIIYRP